ncbi:MAG: 2-oxoacid:acceptor oxidoreductase family protein, partial [Sulfolobales archaeon]
ANTVKKPKELAELLGSEYRYATINATRISLEVFRLPIVNTAMTAALIASARILDLEHLVEAVRTRFSARLAALNELVIRKSYELTEVV